MRILVTGGGGFIGSSFLVNLPYEHKIVCLDHGRKYSKLQKLVRDNVKLIKGDVTDANLVDDIIRDVHVIIHLTGGGGNTACMKNPANAVMTYVYGTHLLLQKALKYSVKRFIFASSQSVYGTFKKRRMPLTENMALKPDDLYGALKAAAEYEIYDSNVNYVILRFANVYGYGDGLYGARGGAVDNFVKAAYDRSDITIFGTGKQKIDYINIRDVTRCVKMILENQSIKNEIFNVGSGKLYSIESIAKIVLETIEKLYKHKVNVKKVPAPQGKIWPDRLMSIEKIEHQLKWSPSISLRKGIHEVMMRYGRN